MISTTTTSIDGLVLYHPIIEIWSGTVQIHRDEDLAAATANLPPSALVSDGRKRLVPKDPLRPLLRVRKNVDTLLRRHGFRMMGGIAVPESATGQIEVELPKLQTAFQDSLDELCLNLEDWYQKLEAEYPQWVPMLRKSRLTPQDVRARCRFDVVAIRAAAPNPSIAPQASLRFSRVASAAFPSLLEDMAKRAEEVLKESFYGKSEVTQKQMIPVRRMVEKLESFGFLDPRVAPMADALGKQLQVIPKQGPLDMAQTALVVTVLKTLSDPDLVIQHGVGAISSNTVEPPPIQQALIPAMPVSAITLIETVEDDALDDEPELQVPPAMLAPTPAPLSHIGF